MARDTSTASAARKVWNWIWFAVLAGLAASNGVLLPLARVKFVKMYAEFDIKLPTLSILMLQVPTIVFPEAALLVVGIGLAVQLRWGKTHYPSIYHLTMIVVCVLVLLAMWLALMLPIPALVGHVNQSH